MPIAHLLRAGLAAAAFVAAGTSHAVVKTMVLPADPVFLRPSALPGYTKAQGQCVSCHSAEYMQYQPPTAARPYWDAMVKRMKVVFKATVNEADMPDIVDYLVKTYGNEQPK